MEARKNSWRENRFIKISHDDIQKATEDFSPVNLIGRGGFGNVYKGRLTTNDPPNTIIDIAVKVTHSYIYYGMIAKR